MTTGLALQMKSRLRQLGRRFEVQTDAVIIPLSEPVDESMVLSGVASNASIDLDRVMFTPGSLYWNSLPKLHLKHDTSRTVGSIDSLRYNSNGDLLIVATVNDREAARYNAWSIGARIIDYTLHQVDNPQYHARVHRAELLECSLSDIPSNPQALVTSRCPVSASNQYYDLLLAKVSVLQRMVGLLREINAKPPSPPVHPRSPSSFSSLVTILNQRRST